MNDLDSFDDNKKKCVQCKKYFDKESFEVVEYAGKTLVSTACKDCELKNWAKFFEKPNSVSPKYE